jgi:hypothetical protein
VMSDWTLALFFRRDIVQLGSLRRPRAAFRHRDASSNSD